jgi:hypothetical protein
MPSGSLLAEIVAVYADTAAALIRRTMRRGKVGIRQAVDLAVFSFSSTMFFNFLFVLTLVAEIESASRLQLTVACGIVMYAIHKLNVALMRRWVLDSNAQLKPELTGVGPRQLIGHVYFVSSMLLLAFGFYVLATA